MHGFSGADYKLCINCYRAAYMTQNAATANTRSPGGKDA